MNLMMKKIVNFYKKLGFFQGAILTLCLTSAISIATVNIPGFYTFTGGTPISASQVNSNFEKLANLIDNSRSQNFKAAWDVTTNTPDIEATTPVAGDYYIVSAAGNYTFANGDAITFAAGDWAIYNGISWEKIPAPSSGSSQWTTSASNIYYTTGNVGVGTTAPAQKLDVKGTLRLSGTSSGYVELKAPVSTAIGSYTLPMSDGTSGQVLSTNGAGTLSWVTDSGGGGGTVTSVSGVAPISVTNGTSTPSISLSQANTSTNGYLSSADWNTFNSKQESITSGTTTQYYRGDKSWQTLNTDAVSEGVNLYFTNARTLGVPLTGFASSSNVVVTSSDSVLQAFEKLQGQINAVNSTASSFLMKNSTDSITGTVNVTGPGQLTVQAPIGLNDAVNKQYVDNSISSSATWAVNAGDINRLTGRVGIGTTTPAEQLHLYSTGDTRTIVETNNMSFNAQTIYKQVTSQANIGFMAGGDFVIQTMNTNMMKFGTQAATRMTITPSGNVGIGTISPSATLDVNGPANIMGSLNANSLTINGMTNANGDININSGFALKINSTPICTTSGCTSVSDKRYKENIVPLENSLEKILSLQAYEYDFKKEFKISDKHQIGVIAQDVEKVFPEVVMTDKKTGLKSVAYDHLVAPLIESVKSIYKAVVNIKKQISFHEQEIESLKAENKMLKDYLCQKDKDAPMCE